MIKILFKKYISIAAAFAVVLSLSCCGTGDEVLIDEIDTETVSVETETTTSETTEMTIKETPSFEVSSFTPEEAAKIFNVTPEELAILKQLNSYEIEIWKNMPDIVTMRGLWRYDNDDNFLYVEVFYIDKFGSVKKFIHPDTPNLSSEVIEWLYDKIDQNKDAEIIDIADIHTLIKFYNILMRIDKDSKLEYGGGWRLSEYIERHYWFELFGVRSDGENGFETLKLSYGDAGDYTLRRNYTYILTDEPFNPYINKKEIIDTYGSDAFDLYLKLDPFMVKGSGGYGNLTGEDS